MADAAVRLLFVVNTEIYTEYWYIFSEFVAFFFLSKDMQADRQIPKHLDWEFYKVKDCVN